MRHVQGWFLLYFIFGFFYFSSAYAQDLQKEIGFARDRVLPALVHVEPVKSYYSTGERRHTLVTGSGFIFSDEGYILTNHHVVENAERVSCTLYNKKKLSAEVIGSDPSTDVAVIKLNLDEWEDGPLPVANLGNSDSLEVGQIVLALGSPLGLSRSVSMGVVSSIDRYFEDTGQMISPYNLWIQTDAAINPGNSGGPLINLDGFVIGINSRGVFLAENLGFAIPINLAKEIAGKLISGKMVKRSWLGIEFQPIKDLREYLNKPGLQGVLVSNIEPLSPAAKADLKPGDVLQSIGGTSINADYEEDLPNLRKIIADLPVNEPVEITVWRNSKSRTLKLKTQLEPFEYTSEFECSKLGFVVKGITRFVFQLHELPDYEGVLISAVKNGEIAEQSGLRAGDIIRIINYQKIVDMEDFKSYCNELAQQDITTVFVEVLRSGAPYFAALDFSKTENPEN